MTFEKKFSKNIIQPKCENYFTCFEVLSEILQNGLGFHLLEPLAKVVNEMTQNSDNQKEGLVRSQLDNEIEELEK